MKNFNECFRIPVAIYLTILILPLFLLTGCSSDDEDPISINVPIYSCGYYVDGAYNIPCVWADTVKTNLDLPVGYTSGKAYAIDIYSGSIYVAGVVDNGVNYKAGYWVNGSWTDVSTDQTNADTKATDIYLYNSIVHVTGLLEDGGGDLKTFYWKSNTHNTTLNLGDEVTDGTNPRLFLDVNDVYIAGRDAGEGCFWKIVDGVVDTTNTDLDASDYPTSIVVDDNDHIHLAGYKTIDGIETAYYWNINDPSANSPIEITGVTLNATGTRATYISNYGSTIYIAGKYTNSTTNAYAFTWNSADGLATYTDNELNTNEENYAYLLDYSGANFFCGGGIIDGSNTLPALWFRGETTTNLATDSATTAFVTDITVN